VHTHIHTHTPPMEDLLEFRDPLAVNELSADMFTKILTYYRAIDIAPLRLLRRGWRDAIDDCRVYWEAVRTKRAYILGVRLAHLNRLPRKIQEHIGFRLQTNSIIFSTPDFKDTNYPCWTCPIMEENEDECITVLESFLHRPPNYFGRNNIAGDVTPWLTDGVIFLEHIRPELMNNARFLTAVARLSTKVSWRIGCVPNSVFAAAISSHSKWVTLCNMNISAADAVKLGELPDIIFNVFYRVHVHPDALARFTARGTLLSFTEMNIDRAFLAAVNLLGKHALFFSRCTWGGELKTAGECRYYQMEEMLDNYHMRHYIENVSAYAADDVLHIDPEQWDRNDRIDEEFKKSLFCHYRRTGKWLTSTFRTSPIPLPTNCKFIMGGMPKEIQ